MGLMRVVDRAMAALDTHRGVSGVVRNGLGFLRNMASAGENQVGCIVCCLGGPSPPCEAVAGHTGVCTMCLRVVGRGDG